MMTTDQDREAIREATDRFLDHLMELGCDSIRIFITTSSQGSETHADTSGRGNFNAQVGQVKGWIVRQDEYERLAAQDLHCMEDDDDDD